MKLAAKEKKFISKEALDEFVELYQKGLITHRSFVDTIIQHQKRLVVKEISGSNVIETEILSRRMSNKGVEVLI